MTLQDISDISSALLAKAKANPPRLAPDGAYRRHTGLCVEACPTCGGSGYLRYDVPPENAFFGKLQPCPSIPAENQGTRWYHGLTVREQRELSWESVEDYAVSIRVGSKPIEKIDAGKLAQRIREYLARQGWGWIWLAGVGLERGHEGEPRYGIAKTLILKVAVAEALRSKTPAAYIRMTEIVDDIKAAFDEAHPGEAAQRRLDEWANIPVLAIDEAEKFNPTPWALDRLLLLMDRRHAAALERRSITLIASNKRPELIDGAFGSRARDGRYLYIEVDGPDARPAMTVSDLF